LFLIVQSKHQKLPQYLSIIITIMITKTLTKLRMYVIFLISCISLFRSSRFLFFKTQVTQATTITDSAASTNEGFFSTGLFEKDIVLTESQAEAIFSKFLNNKRRKRKVLNSNPDSYNRPDVSNSTLWSQERTIFFLFDGIHCKILLF
jgi:hypothetical protein